MHCAPFLLTMQIIFASVSYRRVVADLRILKKILHDGYIKSGWSLRNFVPTIYGPKSAVCFTEMPLYALVDYAKTRRISGYVGNYGIAFRRNELFAAGARNVIYGLSTAHLEAEVDEKGIFQGRLLSVKETGIGTQEQYRYVATNLVKGDSLSLIHI